MDAHSIGVEIEGLIDLGPKWSYEYKLLPIHKQNVTLGWPDTLNTSKILHKVRKGNELQNDLQPKLTVREGHEIKNKSSETRQRLNFTHHNTHINREQRLVNIHDIVTKKEQKDIEKIKETVMKEEKIKRYKNKSKYRITRLNVANLGTFSKKYIKNKIENNKRIKFSTEEKRHIKYQTANSGRNANRKKITMEHKLKENKKIYDFIIHIFKQSLKVFDDMLKICELERIKRKIKSLKKSYIDKFSDFLNKSKNYKIITKLGNQKVILNTIETSMKILQRLVNQLSTYMENEKIDRSRSRTANIFQREVDREKLIEFTHACKKFGACRSREDFSDFVIDVIGILLQVNDSKIKQSADALTEVVKTTDFTNVIDNDTQNKLRMFMNDVELADPYFVRAVYLILRNAIIHKNHPIVIMDAIDKELAAKTIAFHDLIDILNKNILISHDDNGKEWDDVKKHLSEWKDGVRVDILRIFEIIIKQIKKGLDKMDAKTAQEVNEKMRIMYRPSSMTGNIM